ncbi:type II secretion system F family protein [Burkholderia lata]|uniref:Membrane protein n=1 Tax=Burkholderia lata (strain ATCC 17760 / DSM 23089 / LMG 22485 / NCIMB 9086 / R18194 / 383) TaxID=482957 RepID=A0A6P2UPV3_BURL3|nr:type II secretion system F family protein [Burkholderia lata]VWC70990.1 membrane protein [Burkholderia lata]
MTANQLGSLALALGALGVVLLALLALRRASAQTRSDRTLASALERRNATLEAAGARVAQEADESRQNLGLRESAVPSRLVRVLDRLSMVGTRLLDTRIGRYLVADEDRLLLEQCGFVDTRTRGLFLSARLACSIVMPLLFIVLIGPQVNGGQWRAGAGIALVTGFMVPKLYLRRRAAQRRQAVVDELPLLVDMLRLLQGVGLSLDQSIQVVTNDFRGMMPVLSLEMEIAQRQFAAGRTREQSLQRLSSGFENEDLRAIVRLLIQVDKHGGAVQEPLKQFGDRLREARRAMLRERIGKLTVKMTGVMILTLLPALLIVTAGPGMISVLRALSQAQH